MIIKNKVVYQPIFSELAKFLVDYSTISVYFLYGNSKEKTKVLLDKSNVDEYCKIYDEAWEKRELNCGLFMCIGVLPKIKFTVIEDAHGCSMKIEESYGNEYNHLNWL